MQWKVREIGREITEEYSPEVRNFEKLLVLEILILLYSTSGNT